MQPFPPRLSISRLRAIQQTSTNERTPNTSSRSRRSTRWRAHNRGIPGSQGTRGRQILLGRATPPPAESRDRGRSPPPPASNKGSTSSSSIYGPGRVTLDHPPVDTVRAYDHAICSLPTLYATVLVPTSIRFTANVVSKWMMANNSLYMYCSTLGLTLSLSSVGR